MLTVQRRGPTLDEARGRAYEAIDRIRFEGAAYRTRHRGSGPAGADGEREHLIGKGRAALVGILWATASTSR